MAQPIDPKAAEEHLHSWISAIPPNSEWESRTELEQTILLVYTLELEVSNGGFEQYFSNPAGDRWRETLQAVQRIGAIRIEEIFLTALTTFPKSAPSTEQLIRSHELQNMNPKATSLLERLTEKYYMLYKNCPEEDSYAKMAHYILRVQGPTQG